MDLLQERDTDETYLAAAEGTEYVIYFPQQGTVRLDLNRSTNSFKGRWIDVSSGDWGESFELAGGRFVELSAPNENGWVAVIIN